MVDTCSPNNPTKLICTFSIFMFSIPISFKAVKKMILIAMPMSTNIRLSRMFITFNDIIRASSCGCLNVHTSWLKNVNECSYSRSNASYSGATELTIRIWDYVADTVKPLISEPSESLIYEPPEIVFMIRRVSGGDVPSLFPLSATIFPRSKTNSFRWPCLNNWTILAFNYLQFAV